MRYLGLNLSDLRNGVVGAIRTKFAASSSPSSHPIAAACLNLWRAVHREATPARGFSRPNRNRGDVLARPNERTKSKPNRTIVQNLNYLFKQNESTIVNQTVITNY